MTSRHAAECRRQKAAIPRGPAFCLLFFAVCLAGVGCHRCDLVEAELRSKDTDLRDIRAELARTEAYNCALQREIGHLRQNSAAKLTPEEAARVYTLRSINLGRQTGGYDDDGVPGDEALQIVLEPLDPDGHAVKAPGTLRVQAFEVMQEGVKKPLSWWVVPPDELRRRWRSGLLSTGYFVVLPWKAWPTTEKLRVVVQFVLPDGRLFEADKDVSVHLGPLAKHAQVPIIEGPIEGPEIILPPPRKVDSPVMVMPEAVSVQKPNNGVQLLQPVPRRQINGDR